MYALKDAFISYGRADSKEFAISFNDRLGKLGYSTWFDFENIPLGVDYQKQIDDGITKAHNFIFIIAPHSVNSPYCGLEIELALRYRKRIIPVLHVEQIDYTTWQNRNPGKSEADWLRDQGAGKHSAFVNMHREIAKINWVYMRDGLDDFEAGLQGIINIMQRQSFYVTQHTQLLNLALSWQGNGCPTTKLLAGEQLEEAVDWLATSFPQEQPPCYPIDLHCDFIGDSVKYSQGDRAEVFLCYAPNDRAKASEIYHSLVYRGVTVWDPYRDLKLGQDRTAVMNQALEEACNVVYFVAKATIDSGDCDRQLSYAAELHKRIIPIQAEPIPRDQWPRVIMPLNTIDLTNNIVDDDYYRDQTQLLKIIHTDQKYYIQHRNLLELALKWHRQNNNRSILLRGPNLQSILIWMKLAINHGQHPPTRLQWEFVQASEAEPPVTCLDIFLGCTATDFDLGRRLYDALQLQGKLIYFTDNFTQDSQLDDDLSHQIEQCDNCIFILSALAVIDPYFCIALDYAIELNKRIIFINYRPLDLASLPTDVETATHLDFYPGQEVFADQFNQLLRTLENDREYVQEHTRWLQWAIRWQKQDQDPDLLLRGRELILASTWLDMALDSAKKPAPQTLHISLIRTSEEANAAAEALEQDRQTQLLNLQAERAREAEARLLAESQVAQRQKLLLGVVSGGLILSLILAGFSLWSYRRSVVKGRSAAIGQLDVLVELSNSYFATHNTLESLLKALEAQELSLDLQRQFPVDPQIQASTLEVLQQAVYNVREHNRLLGQQGRVLGLAVSPNYRWIAAGGDDQYIYLWDTQGVSLGKLQNEGGRVVALAASPDDQTLAAGSTSGWVNLWTIDGVLLHRLKHDRPISSVVFRGDGQVLATGDQSGTVSVWSQDGRLLHQWIGHQDQITGLVFNDRDQSLWSASADGTLKQWDSLGNLLREQPGDQSLSTLTLSLAGNVMATGRTDGMIQVRDIQGNIIRSWLAHGSLVSGLVFNQQGDHLSSSSFDNSLGLWTLNGQQESQVLDHKAPVQAVQVLANNQWVSGSWDGSVRIWAKTIPGREILNTHTNVVRSVLFTPDQQNLIVAGSNMMLQRWALNPLNLTWQQAAHTDLLTETIGVNGGESLLSGSWDGTIDHWTGQGIRQNTITADQGQVLDLALSPDSRWFLSGGSDGTVKRWLLAGDLQQVYQGSLDQVNGVATDPQGEFVLGSSADGTVHRWNLDGTGLRQWQAHGAPVTDITFSLDGEYILTASLDKTLKIWSRSGDLLGTLGGHSSGLMKIALNPDGDTIATAGIDYTIKLWSLKQQALITTVRGYRSGVLALTFSGDGSLLASGDARGQVIAWHWRQLLDSQQLMFQGCHWLQNYFHVNQDGYGDLIDFCAETIGPPPTP